MTDSRGWGETSTWVRVGIISWSLLGIIVIGAGLVALLVRLWAVMLPLVVGGIIVFLLKSPVAWMCSKGMKRIWASVIAYLGMFAVFTAFGFYIAPVLRDQFTQFVSAFPIFYDRAQLFVEQIQQKYDALQPSPWMESMLVSMQEHLAASISKMSGSLASGILSAGGSIVGVVLGLFLGLIIGFYLLASLPQVERGVLGLFPPTARAEAAEIGRRINVVVGGFIRGQAIVALIVGVLTGITMAVIGVPYALMIGVIAGVTNIIPYLGPIVGGTVAAIVALFVDPWLMVWAIVTVIAIQQVESTFLSPKIMSDQVGLHPVVVILSLAAGASLAGLTGMLLAVPVAGTVKAVWSYYTEKHGWTEAELPSPDDSDEEGPSTSSSAPGSEVQVSDDEDRSAAEEGL